MALECKWDDAKFNMFVLQKWLVKSHEHHSLAKLSCHYLVKWPWDIARSMEIVQCEGAWLAKFSDCVWWGSIAFSAWEIHTLWDEAVKLQHHYWKSARSMVFWYGLWSTITTDSSGWFARINQERGFITTDSDGGSKERRFRCTVCARSDTLAIPMLFVTTLSSRLKEEPEVVVEKEDQDR